MSKGTLEPERGLPPVGLTGEGVAHRGYLRLGSLAGLFLIEILALTLRFDGRTIQEGVRALSEGIATAASSRLEIGSVETPRAWVVWLLVQSNIALALMIAATSATLLFGGRGLSEGLTRAAESSWGKRSRRMLAAHFIALAAFWWLTVWVFEGGAIVSAWALSWVASGLAVVVFLVMAALPPCNWTILARLWLRATPVGLTVALAATGTGLLARRLWEPLGLWTMEAVHSLLVLTHADVYYDRAKRIIGMGAFRVGIAPQCSGYEGIGLVWTFLAAYLWLCRRELRFPRAWLLLPLGTAAIWLANVLRIAALIMVGAWISADVAAGGFHSKMGWIGFNTVVLGLVLLTRKCRYFHRDGEIRIASATGVSREAVYLAPLMAIVAASMLCGAISPGGFDRYYAARLAAVALPLWLYRREYASLRWDCSWHAVATGIFVFALWVARWPHGAGGSTAMGNWGMVWTSAWLLSRIAGSVVTVPLAEELAFRGFLTRRLIAADFDAIPPGRFTWASFAISSIAFGVLHDRWLEGTLAGMCYALAYRRRGSLGDAVAAHATTNSMLCADALMTGDWSLFS